MLKLQHRASSCPSPHHGRVRTQVWQLFQSLCSYLLIRCLLRVKGLPKGQKVWCNFTHQARPHMSTSLDFAPRHSICPTPVPAPCSHRLIYRCICAEEILKKDLCLCLWTCRDIYDIDKWKGQVTVIQFCWKQTCDKMLKWGAMSFTLRW